MIDQSALLLAITESLAEADYLAWCAAGFAIERAQASAQATGLTNYPTKR